MVHRHKAFRLFESRVVLEGSKTQRCTICHGAAFESRVVLEGSKTNQPFVVETPKFESRVVLEGSKTLASVSENH